MDLTLYLNLCLLLSLLVFFTCVVTEQARAGAAMPFGCLTLGDRKDYNNPSEVTDKYDLGQIVKT